MTGSDIGSNEPAAPPVRRRSEAPEVEVTALAVMVWLASALLLAAVPDRGDALRPGATWAFVAAVLLFAAGEYVIFEVEFRREGITFTMSEIPLALSLAYLNPVAAVVARLALAVVGLTVFRRNRGVKLFFNVGIYTLDVVLSVSIVRWLLSWWGTSSAALLSAVILAMAASSFTTSIIISLAISRYEGGAGERIVSEIRSTWWLYPVSSVLAAMTLSLSLVEPALTLFAVLPIGAVWLVIRAFGQRQQTMRDLDALHGFAGMLGRTLDVEEIGDLAVAEIERLMRAGGACVVRFAGEGAAFHRSGELPFALPESAGDVGWRPILDVQGSTTVDASMLRAAGIDPGDMRRTALVSPLVDDGQLFGMVAVYQRDKLGSEFDEHARTRMRSIVEQLTVSLRRGILHERLEYEARHDSLTGLPARSLFERFVARAVEGSPTPVTVVMMLDLDRFKEVNDTLGHHAGDTLLIEFSRRIQSLLGPDDQLARLAGDEFAILATRPSQEDVLELARACVHEGGRPVVLDGLEIVVTVSLGVADVFGTDTNAVQPMRRADIAMYNAKWQRTGVEVYRDEIDRRTPARLSMLGDLRSAIQNDRLDVVYQPKLDLATHTVIGVEALVRWDHEVRGVVAPSEFVRVAEDTGLIKELTDLVLGRGIAALRRFQDLGLELGLAVNLSTHDLFDARLPDRVRGYLDAHGVDASLLTLEITESSLLVDAPRTQATIDGLHQVGLRLAVDDFGTGYSSLSYLRRLPVQELKIDQSFVSRMITDPQDEVIVRSTVELGHNLGLKVVAEGVESRAILDRLTLIGCDVAQGYGISVPLAADDLIAWLRRYASVG